MFSVTTDKRRRIFILSQMSKHFAAIDEWHAEIQVAIILHRELQTDDKGKFDCTQYFLFIQRVIHLLALHDLFLADDFHCIEFLCRIMFHKFLN